MNGRKPFCAHATTHSTAFGITVISVVSKWIDRIMTERLEIIVALKVLG
ncbi:MAG: hypothetical protein WC047_00780 [Kiritimatiellales bacterium]